MRTYTELISLPTFRERFEYLKLGGSIGEETFGAERYRNQVFYRSPEWQAVRRQVVMRDNGCDLACPDREIFGRVYIHHMNPITIEDIERRSKSILDLDNLISVTRTTHDQIHYGDGSLLFMELVERKPNDTCPWRK